ncbi:MAG: TolC family protein [Desulfamplus sp.]|nr:TolC family protein [Desulfamplus sp.]
MKKFNALSRVCSINFFISSDRLTVFSLIFVAAFTGYFLVGTVLFNVAFSSYAYAGEKVLSLNDCLKLGMANNPKLTSAKFMIDAAQEELNAAKADFLPSVNAGANYNNINSIDASGPTDMDFVDEQNTSYNIGISQFLYAGNRLVNSRDRAIERKKMFIEEKSYTQAELAYQIKSVYFELMKAQQDVQIGVDTVKRLEADATAVRAFYEKEMAAYAQVLQAEVDLADAKQQLSRVKNTVDRKRSELFVLMNQPFNPDMIFSGGLDYYGKGFKMTAEQCLAKAVASRPDLKSMEHQIIMYEKDIELAKSKYHPVVKLNAGYYDQDKDYDNYHASNQENTYWSAGVNLSWNLFDGGRAWYEKNRSKIDIKRIKEQVKDIKSRIEAGIITALLSLSEAEERITATSESINAAKEYHDMESKRFQAGIATISSVLDAQVRVTRAHSNYNQALLDYQLARAELDFLTGSALGE